MNKILFICCVPDKQPTNIQHFIRYVLAVLNVVHLLLCIYSQEITLNKFVEGKRVEFLNITRFTDVFGHRLNPVSQAFCHVRRRMEFIPFERAPKELVK